jgi:L-aspartate oxidase
VISRASLEAAALTVTARAVAAAAVARDESRACHQRADHPDTAPAQARSIVVRLADDGNSAQFETLAAAC